MGKGPSQVTDPNQTLNAGIRSVGVRLRAIRFVAERVRAQTAS